MTPPTRPDKAHPRDRPWNQARNFLWLPSQSGGVAVCLHWHHQTVVLVVVSNFTGCRPVPLWLPSQNGGWLERPQAHHQWTPASTSRPIGFVSQTTGSSGMPSRVGDRAGKGEQRIHRASLEGVALVGLDGRHRLSFLRWCHLFRRNRHRAPPELRVAVDGDVIEEGGDQPDREQRGRARYEKSDFHQQERCGALADGELRDAKVFNRLLRKSKVIYRAHIPHHWPTRGSITFRAPGQGEFGRKNCRLLINDQKRGNDSYRAITTGALEFPKRSTALTATASGKRPARAGRSTLLDPAETTFTIRHWLPKRACTA